ncbi:MAG TPA: NADPH:quinone reductase [Thermomicrobiales bacterium]|jgi:NADPH2:quinone reductase|nr:NADPH:quinone reductase [Thermomicrobiales bacterium]
MRAAWFDHKGDARQVLTVGDLPDPEPTDGEVRVRLTTSGVNPGDAKKRQDWLGTPMAFPRIIPHSDGAGVVDLLGPGVPSAWQGRRVWVWGAQSYRAFGTAAEYVVVPVIGNRPLAVSLPDAVSDHAGAALGIAARTAHRSVFADGPVAGLRMLVTGGAGTVGNAAIALATWGGAQVVATTSSAAQADMALEAGAVATVDRHGDDLVDRLLAANDGRPFDRIIDVAFGGNITTHEQVIATGGVIAAYASDADPMPRIPFWELLFRNVVIRLIGSDDFPDDAERQAQHDITACLTGTGWRPTIARTFPLAQIADAHELVERGGVSGHVLLDIAPR